MKSKENIKKLLINLVSYIFGSSFIYIFLGLFLNINKVCLKMLSSIIIWIILIIFNIKEIKENYKKFNIHSKEKWNITIKYYICGLILMILSNFIINTFTHTLPINEAQNRIVVNKYPIYSLISMVMVAPLLEEITFRLSFKNVFKDKNLFLLISTFIFGFIHVFFNGDYINIIPYMALGYFLGKIYYETDNLFYSYLVHAAHNLICIIMIFIGEI